MNMDQSIRDTLNQLVALQAQQLSAINAIANSNSGMGAKSPQLSSYANYAPDFTPPMAPFSQSTQAAQQRFSNYAGQVAGGNSFSDIFFANKSKMSTENRNQMATDYGARFTNAAIAGGGVVASGAADLGAMALAPGLISGVAAGAVGGAVVGGLFDIALQQNQQHLAYNSFLQRESYRFINPMNSKNERDISGFSTNERYAASTYLRHFGVDNKISSEETSQLLEKFTEGNLFKGVKDLEGFKDKMQKMTQYVKQSALLLNETFGSVATLMADMQKAGIDTTNFDYLSAKSKVVGSFTGQAAGDVLRNSVNSATGITQGTNFTNAIQAERIGDTTLYMDAYYQKMRDTKGPLNPKGQEMFNLITNMGGVQGATNVAAQKQNSLLSNSSFMSNAVLFYDYNKDSNSFTFNPEAFKNFSNGTANANELSRAAVGKLNSLGAAGSNAWMRNGQSYLMNSLDDDQSKKFLARNLKALQSSSGVDAIKNGNLSYQDIMSMVMGDNSNEGKLFGGMLDYYQQDNGTLKRNAANLSYQQNMIAKINSNRAGFGYEVKNVWEGFKVGVGDATVGIGEGITNLTQKASDWWYGKQYQVDRSGSSITPEAMKAEGANITNNILKGVQEGLKDAKAKGFNVKDDVLKMFSASDSDMNDWKSKVIEYKREVYKSMDELGKDVGKYAQTVRSASEAANVSETTVAGMIKYGRTTGTAMGMSDTTMADISKSINKNIYTAGDDEKYQSGIKYLGQLVTAYGGNQDLANMAFATSKAQVDAALQKAGVATDIEALRRSGNQNTLQGVKLGQIKQYFNQGDQEKMTTLNKYITGGGRTTFDETQKPGLGAHPDTTRMIREAAAKLGTNDENLLATLFSIENGGSDKPNYNTNGSVDYGPAQLNDRGFVTGMIGNSYSLPSGRNVTVGQDNWKTDKELNVYLGSKIFTDKLNEAQGNPALAYALYNGGGTFTDSKETYINVIKQRLRKRGVKEADLDKEVGKMSSEEVLDVLRTGGASKTADNVGRFMDVYYKGLLPGKDARAAENTVLMNANGSNLTDDQKKQYRDSLITPGFNDTTSFNFEGFKEAYTKFTHGPDESLFKKGYVSPLLSAMESGGAVDLSAKEPVYKGFAKMWGMDYDGSSTSFSKLSERMRDEFSNNKKMMDEFDSASDKGSTAWGKLTTSERMARMSTNQMISTLRGDKATVDPAKYMTAQDIEESKKIETAPGMFQGFAKYGKLFGYTTGFFSGDSLLKNEGKAGGENDPAKLLNWMVSSGKYSVSGDKVTGNTSIGQSIGIWQKQIDTLQREEKQARIDADAMASNDIDFGSNISSENKAKYQDIIKRALTGDKGAQSELYNLQIKLGKDMNQTGAALFSPGSAAEKEYQDKTIFGQVNKALGLSYKLQGADISQLKAGVAAGEKRKQNLTQFGTFGATLMGMITGDDSAGVDFQKRFLSQFADKDFNNVNWNEANKIVVSGQQELVDKLVNQTGDQRKTFYDSLKSNMPEADANKIQTMMEDALKSSDKNSGMKKVVDEITNIWGAATKDQTADQASANSDAAKTLADSTKSLTDEIVTSAKKFNDTAIALQKSQQDLEKQQNVVKMQGSGVLPY